MIIIIGGLRSEIAQCWTRDRLYLIYYSRSGNPRHARLFYLARGVVNIFQKHVYGPFFFRDHPDFGEKNREIRDEIEVKTFFFFFREHPDFGRKIGKSEMKSKRRLFFFREHPDFGRKIGKSEMKSK